MKKKNGKRIIAGLLAAGLFAASVISPLEPDEPLQQQRSRFQRQK
jgi:hypothetical protein